MENNQNKIPYKHCLNCGEELQGKYCHKCGQYASEPVPKIKEFLIEYANHAFIWDSKLVPTLWKLITKPGFLTNEFIRGKFNSYEHPLKLNMFFLFMFITLFIIFSDNEKLFNKIDDRIIFTTNIEKHNGNDSTYSNLHDFLNDTIKLISSNNIVNYFPNSVRIIDSIDGPNHEGESTYIAVISHYLIEDNYLQNYDNGHYRFREEIYETVAKDENKDIIRTIFNDFINFITSYFPLIFMLTTPLLSISIRLMNRDKRITRIWNYVFSLHYTAFLTLLILLGYILALMCNIDIRPIYIIILGTIYLTMASHEVFNNNSWVKSFFKAVMTNIVYIIICTTILSLILYIITMHYLYVNVSYTTALN